VKKGALVELMSAFGASVPNVIIFQYNPETLRHTWTQTTAPANPAGQSSANPYAVPGEPTEAFSFSLSMEATDQLADPIAAAATAGTGIYTRLAALEMLLFPAKTDAPPAGQGESRPTPAAQLAPVLFVWGTGRIVPVRVTSLTINEKLYDEDLNPTHAEAQIELRVLTQTELQWITGMSGTIASMAAAYSQGLRETRATANLGDAARVVTGMLHDAKIPGF
jgi:hypothetical protein